MTKPARRGMTPGFMLDLALGAGIMGSTGAVIGLTLGGPLLTAVTTAVGILLGASIAFLNARRFFISILIGTVVCGALALALGGSYALVIGAGTGGAVGGFIGITIELLLRERRQ